MFVICLSEIFEIRNRKLWFSIDRLSLNDRSDKLFERMSIGKREININVQCQQLSKYADPFVVFYGG